MREMKSKEKTILDRIKCLEDAIFKGREYLETGAHAHWHGFKPIFAEKVKDGKILPPHKDWVKNVFVPSHEKALMENQKILEKLTQQKRKVANKGKERIR
ncbi:MAG: hypothetical protein A2283_21260 [Lentisphaerae bacterium RIFOXYA12_FULL_48_11]|nr:MAG: hypothetical protein A2283_21260 [Lentisphaerae bacterium RIFOXYA12_FULL_48_11]